MLTFYLQHCVNSALHKVKEEKLTSNGGVTGGRLPQRPPPRAKGHTRFEAGPEKSTDRWKDATQRRRG